MPDNEWRMRMITCNNINKELNELDNSGRVTFAWLPSFATGNAFTIPFSTSFIQSRWFDAMAISRKRFQHKFQLFFKSSQNKTNEFHYVVPNYWIIQTCSLNWIENSVNSTVLTALTSTMHIWQWHQQNRLIFECVLWSFIESNWHMCRNKNISSFSRQIK